MSLRLFGARRAPRRAKPRPGPVPGPGETLFWQERLDDVGATPSVVDDEPSRLEWRAPRPADSIHWQPPSSTP